MSLLRQYRMEKTIGKAAKTFELSPETPRQWVMKDAKICFGGGRQAVLSNEEEHIFISLEQFRKTGWSCDQSNLRTTVRTWTVKESAPVLKRMCLGTTGLPVSGKGCNIS